MNLFRSKEGKVFGYDDQQVAAGVVPSGFVPISEDQANALINLSPTTDSLCNSVDTAADAARSRVAGDPLRAVEYDRARIEAQAFADAGYPGDAVPRTVAAWAINGRTAQQAADSILAEAAAYTEALYVIRETRLAAKEQIRTLMDVGEVEQAQQLAEQTVAAIEAAVAGVGNAAA
ncbi:phage tail protein [Stutzerimonas kunmingensis]|uniref:phage tail protein n=1 Tax=Stutzerimonas kunmingensis TaxID=1211807 RepID=UPI0035263603